jgi:hypothetical protein
VVVYEASAITALASFIADNKIERMNGEIRDREKTMRGLKQKCTGILQGYQLHHNLLPTT